VVHADIGLEGGLPQNLEEGKGQGYLASSRQYGNALLGEEGRTAILPPKCRDMPHHDGPLSILHGSYTYFIFKLLEFSRRKLLSHFPGVFY